MTLQDRLFADMADLSLIDRAAASARAHVADALARRVFPTDDAIAALSALEGPLGAGAPAGAVLDEMDAVIRPATAEMLGGRYFGFVNGGVVPAALAARIVADAWDQNAALGVMSPAASRLETIVEGWLLDLFGLPESGACGFVSGSSMAIVCGLAAGRWRLLRQAGWDVNAKGLFGAPELRVVAGREAHSAVLRALRLLGFGADRIEWAPCDAEGRIIPEQAPMIDERTLVLLQAGHVASGAFDPMEAMIAEARAEGAWVHVDGAFGLWAATSPRFAHLTKGMARAHSFSADAHKTLNAPYDNGLVLTTDAAALGHALSASASYLPAGEGLRDGMAYTTEMSRRGRIFELWALLKYLGRDGVGELVELLCDRATFFADELRDAGFHVPHDVVFNQCMAQCATDEETLAAMRGLQASGEAWAGPTDWPGPNGQTKAIRFSVCSWATTKGDIRRAVAALARAREAAR